MKNIFFIIIFIFVIQDHFAQNSNWTRHDSLVKAGLNQIYEIKFENAEKTLPEADIKSMRDEEIMKFFAEDKKEAHKQGADGTVKDVILFARDWGFQLEDIQHKHIFLWHGEEDVNVPIGLVKKVAEAIPNCKATFYRGEGHISLIYNYHNEMMDTLLSVE